MLAKSIDMFKLSELLNQVSPLADVSSIELTGNDYKINFSLDYSALKECNGENALNELHQILLKYGV